MFQTYQKLEDVPEALREHYTMKGGRAVPEVSSDHPLVVNNATLVSEKTEAERQRDDARRDLESAKASGLPRGHVAVAKADADLLEKVKAEGITTAEALTTLKTEHGAFKEEVETVKRDRHLRSVAEVLGYQPEAFALLPNLPEFELRDTSEKDAKGNPKKTAVAKVKDAVGAVTEKPGREFIESSDTYRPLLPALQATQQGFQYLDQSAGGRVPAGNKYEDIRKDVKKREEASRGNASDLHPIFKPQQQAAS